MERFDEIFTKVSDRLAYYVCGSMVLIMMVYICVHVFARYVLRTGGVPGTYAYGGALLVPISYLALSYGWYKRGYVVVDILTLRMKGRVLWGLQFAILLVTLLCFTVWLVYGGIMASVTSYTLQTLLGEPGSRTLVWPWQATIVIGTVLMATRNILDMIKMVRTGEVISDHR